jgi:myosin-5
MQSTDSTFGEKLRHELKAHPCFGFDSRIPSLDFTVRHYAGEVLYSCDRFLDKNRDTLSSGDSRRSRS